MPDEPGREGRWLQGGWDALAVCGVLALAAAVVTGLAWSRPTTTTSSLTYRQSGRLSYSAPVSATSIYGSPLVTTGQPVYTAVVRTLTIRYSYRLGSTAPLEVHGSQQLVASMSNGQGITRTVPLQSRTAFRGDDFSATGTLDVATLEMIALEFSGSGGGGGGGGGGTYDVTISPSVVATGRIGTEPLRTSFDPPVTFSLTSDALVPSTSSAGGAGSGTTGYGSTGYGSTGPAVAHFTTSTTSAVAAPHGQPATLFLGLTVLNLRIAALLVLALALAAAVLVGWPLVRDATSEDERRRIVARHGPALVEARALPLGPGVIVVEITSFEGLLQVAQRTECPILHAELGHGGDAYGVVDNGTVYRYGPLPAEPAAVRSVARANGTIKVNDSFRVNGGRQPRHLGSSGRPGPPPD